MKKSGPALVLLFVAASLLAAPALGEGGLRMEEGPVVEEDKDPVPVERRLVENDGHHDYYESDNKAVGCDCAKSDVAELRRIQSALLMPVSIVLSGRGFHALIPPALEAISGCIEYGIEILGMFRCGGCVDRRSGFEAPSAFTYDCCCDSDQIKDIIEDAVNAIALALPLVRDEQTFATLVAKYKTSASLAIRGIIDDYEDQPTFSSPPPPTVPTFFPPPSPGCNNISPIPSSAAVNIQTISGNDGAAWVCSGSIPFVLGVRHVVYLEENAQAILVGSNDIIYAKAGSKVFGSGSGHTVIHEPGVTVALTGGGTQTFIECADIEFDYTDVPTSRCTP